LASPGEMLICSDTVIEEVSYTGFPLNGPLLMGIGFIPFDRIIQVPGPLEGLADTTVDPTYFYQVKDTPFGGTLPLMVNYQRAANDGAAYYQVRVDGNLRSDSWTDEMWNGTQYVAAPTTPATVGGKPDCYPVHPVSQLFLWMNPSLGSLMDSTNLLTTTPNTHTIQLEFLDASANHVEYSTPLIILVDNKPCVAAQAPVTVNGTAADPCGILTYAKTTDTVTMGFTASQPNSDATFSLSLIRGVTGVTLPPAPPTSGPVSAASSPITDTVGDLLGGCTIAGFALYLYVAATANNGWGRQSQYDASAAQAFVLSS